MEREKKGVRRSELVVRWVWARARAKGSGRGRRITGSGGATISPRGRSGWPDDRTLRFRFLGPRSRRCCGESRGPRRPTRESSGHKSGTVRRPSTGRRMPWGVQSARVWGGEARDPGRIGTCFRVAPDVRVASRWWHFSGAGLFGSTRFRGPRTRDGLIAEEPAARERSFSAEDPLSRQHRPPFLHSNLAEPSLGTHPPPTPARGRPGSTLCLWDLERRQPEPHRERNLHPASPLDDQPALGATSATMVGSGRATPTGSKRDSLPAAPTANGTSVKVGASLAGWLGDGRDTWINALTP